MKRLLTFALFALIATFAAQPSTAAIAVVSNASNTNGAGSTVTISNFTVASGLPGDTYLLVGVSMHSPGSVLSISWNGSTSGFALVGGVTNNRRVEMWALQNPTAATANIVVTTQGGVDEVVAGAVLLSGVNPGGVTSALRQVSGVNRFVTNSATTGTTASTGNFTTAAGDLVMDAVAVTNDGGTDTPGTGQTKEWGISNGTSGDVSGDGSVKPIASGTTTTSTWTLSTNTTWAIVAVSVIPNPAPTITKSFNPTTIQSAGTSLLTLTITNPNIATTLTGVADTDTLPAGMTYSGTPATTCTSGSTTGSTTTKIVLSGASITAGASCTVTATVTSSTPGVSTNTTGTVSSTNGGTGLTASASLTVIGAAAKLAFTVSPSSSTAGVAFGTQPVVALEDASGNIVTGTAQNVQLTIQNNVGSGTLSGTTTVAVNTLTGLATFSGLSINKSGTGYTLTAAGSTVNTSPGTVISGSFNIAPGTATQLVFTTPPSTPNNGGTAFGTQPVVSIEDSLGNVVTTATNAITLAIGTNPVGGALTCTSLNPLPAIAGVATFVGCSINKASAGYTLTASASGLSSTTTGSITIQVGPATKIVFGVSPSNTVAGSPINPAVTVLIEDAGGNVTTSTASVAMAIGTNPGTSTLSGTTPQTAVNGTATFADLSLNKVGTAYTLVASSSGFSNVTSATFNITVGTATQLAFTQQPGGGSGGTAWVTASQPKVSVEDANGNVVSAGTNSNATITLAIGTNSGPGGTLTCTTNPLGASSGVSSFAGCKIDVAGTAYTLTAAAPGLTGATSNPFNITVGTGTQLQFGVQPSDTVDTVAINPAVTVKILDAGGNQTTGTTAITITILNNAGTGTLTGGGPFNAVNGLATFAGLSINKIGTGYTLRAAGTGVGNVTSNAFNILLGSPTQLTFSTEPASTNNHVTMPNVVVQIQDAGGNLVPTASAAVTVAIGANPSTGTLSGTLTQNTSGGAATFNDLSIDNVGTNYTLTATSSPVFTPETSTQFNITAGPASQLVFTTQPSAVSAPGTVFAVQPVVSVEDAHNNIITTGTGSTASITLAIGVNAGPGGVLTCTATTKSATAGVDAFAGCKINLAGNGYTLTAAASGFTTVSSSPFSISLGATKQIGEQLAGSCSSTTTTCTIALNASALATSNNMLLVGVSIGHNSTTSPTVSGITWNGSALAPVASCSNTASNATGGNSARIEIWSLANPSLVSSNVVVTLSAAAQHSYAGAGFFSNVSALGTCTTLQSSGGSSSSASLSVTVPAGGASFDTLAVNTTTSVVIAAPPATQTSISNTSVGSSGGATSFGIAPISTMSRSWNQNTSIDAYGALSLIPTVSHKTGGKVIIGSLLEQEKPSPSIFHLGDSMRSTTASDSDQRSNDSNTAIINKRDN